MKVLIQSVQDEGETITTVATVELVGGLVVIQGPPSERAFLRDYRTVAPDGTWHTIDEGEIWVSNLVRSLRGTYAFAQFAETDA
jgi:hypothetical protein